MSKYRKGRQIIHVLEFVREVMEGKHVMLDNSPIHPAFCKNLTLLTINRLVDNGRCAFAELNQTKED